VCVNSFKAENTDVGPGDASCQKKVCDGKGAVQVAADTANKPGNTSCALYACNGTKLEATSQPAGTDCDVGKVCDDKGECVGVCKPGAKSCEGLILKTCLASAIYDAGVKCEGATPFCDNTLEACVACTSADQCPPSSSVACGAAICAQGVCALDLKPDDTVVSDASAVDCQQQVCKAGAEVSAAHDTETPDDGDPCTIDVCSGGVPGHQPKCVGATSCCSGSCFDLDNDSQNCGGCGKDCLGDPCKKGVCDRTPTFDAAKPLPTTAVAWQTNSYLGSCSDAGGQQVAVTKAADDTCGGVITGTAAGFVYTFKTIDEGASCKISLTCSDGGLVGALASTVLTSSTRSCQGLALCGSNSESCCQSIETITTAAGSASFMMGAGSVAGDTDYDASPAAAEAPEHQVTLSSFYLDKFEVSVGRFRKFVDAYDKASLLLQLKAGLGTHPKISDSGWQPSWDSFLAADATALKTTLKCDASQPNWKDTAGTTASENLPVNCVNWFHAFAFCAWDGGRLPTEAEWEYAAAGGAQDLLYPWGKTFPTSTSERKTFGALPSYNNQTKKLEDSMIPVGSRLPGSAAYFGHSDLIGNVNEWTLDLIDYSWYSKPGATAMNPARLNQGEPVDFIRMMRGTSVDNDFAYNDDYLRSALRSPSDLVSNKASFSYSVIGLRCARTR
jgi:formylglycine-generating enzyme required for sulfatase activity